MRYCACAALASSSAASDDLEGIMVLWPALDLAGGFGGGYRKVNEARSFHVSREDGRI